MQCTKVLGYKLALQHRELAVHYTTDAEVAGANRCSHYTEKKGIEDLRGTDNIGASAFSNESVLAESLSIRNILPMLTSRHSA